MKTLVEISIASACVNACPYCIARGTKSVAYDKWLNAEGGGLYLNPVHILDFAQTLQEAHPEGLVIAITGGEPMCHPGFECILDSLGFVKGNSKIALFTNLKLLTAKRAEYIDRCVDYAIIGYHPSQNAMLPDGGYCRTDLDWLGEKMKMLHIPCAINYIAGAYASNEAESEKHLAEFELNALKRKLQYVKTPMRGTGKAVSLRNCNVQLKPAPDMLSVRPDGAIILCAGKPGIVGSIYGAYDKEQACRENCPLCPSYYPFFGMEHLFAEEN